MRPACAPSIVPVAEPEPTRSSPASLPSLAASADAVRVVAAQMRATVERDVATALTGLARARVGVREEERRS
jgi:hypothetical protein